MKGKESMIDWILGERNLESTLNEGQPLMTIQGYVSKCFHASQNLGLFLTFRLKSSISPRLLRKKTSANHLFSKAVNKILAEAAKGEQTETFQLKKKLYILSNMHFYMISRFKFCLISVSTDCSLI